MSTSGESPEVELLERVNALVNAMARPLFMWRMAAPLAKTHPDTAQTRSARTRLAIAAREIDRIATLYAAHAEAPVEVEVGRSLDAVD